jgi:hypothetical protein
MEIIKIFPAPVDVGGLNDSWLVTARIKREDGYKDVVVVVSTHTPEERVVEEGYYPTPSVGNAKELIIKFNGLWIGEEIDLTDPEEEEILQKILEAMEVKPSR